MVRSRPVAEVKPFRAVRYGERAGPLESLVAPPYDVISAPEREQLAGRSPHNVVHLTLPKDEPEAGRLWHAWRADGALVEEDDPGFWWLSQDYIGPDGVARTREGLVAALRAEPYENRVILPHERTHRGPKEGRLRLMREVQAQLEPLFFLYEGAPPATRPEREPDLEVEGARLWRLPPEGISEAFADRQLLIADGHHRYETALAYAEEVGGPPDAASRFTLALLTDIDDPGLEVLPTHRVLKAGVAVTGGEDAPSLEATLAGLHGRVAAGVYHDHRFQVLPLEGNVAVVELHEQVIDNILGKRNPEDFLLYTRDAGEAVRWVDEGVGVGAFFLDAPDPRQVLKLAQEGKTLPQKSTYFYPKPPSGMVFLRLDANRRI